MKREYFMIVHKGEDINQKGQELIISDLHDYFETYLSDFFYTKEEADRALAKKIEETKGSPYLMEGARVAKVIINIAVEEI